MSLMISQLSCDFKTNPLGIENVHPLLDWKLESETAGAAQKAYRICVATAVEKLDAPDLWDSGRVNSCENRAVYAGKAVQSNQKVFWRVCVWDEQDRQSAWSQIASWRQGIARENWQGEWIGYDEGRDAYDLTQPYYCADDFDLGESEPFLPKPALLRSEFIAKGNVISATLYVSALGLTEMYLNGEKANSGHMVPGIADYRKRVYYHAYDVTSMIEEGENAISGVIADGWYAGYIGLNPRQWWGAKPRLNAELHIEYADGTVQLVTTCAGWKAMIGPWLYADIMHGTGYDATLEPCGWKKTGYDDSAWHAVETGAEYDHTPEAHPGVPVVEHDRYPAVEIRRINEDEAIVDFGRCFSGVCCMKLRGPRGARFDIIHAEEMERDGSELYLFGNRSARVHDCYILSGDGEENFQPEFTYHGFRYAHVYGLMQIELISIEGVAISSALPEATEIVSGNKTVNEVLWMIRNTQQSNQYETPTDVCARDERLGWGAEGHFFMHTAAALNNNALFMRKWMQDIVDGQGDDGAYWAIAPAVMMKDITPFAGDLQSHMGVHCAWLLARYYKDTEFLKGHFESLERYFEFCVGSSDRMLRFATAHDWLDLCHDGHSDYDHGYGKCDPTLLGTAWFARLARMMTDISEAIGENERADYYREMYGKIRWAFRTFFIGRNKLLRGATQGGYMVAAAFGLIEGEEIEVARKWVLEDMEKNGGITWGTASTPVALFGMDVLGLQKEAAAFVRRREFPSLGYMLDSGATAVWERWDTIRDNKFHPHQMNAFDHIGLATVGEWMFMRLAGVMPEENGFDTVRIQPQFDEEIGSMHTNYHSIHGDIGVDWKYEADGIHIGVKLPVGCRGKLVLAANEGAIRIVRGGENGVECRCADGETTLCLTSGRYEFIMVPN